MKQLLNTLIISFLVVISAKAVDLNLAWDQLPASQAAAIQLAGYKVLVASNGAAFTEVMDVPLVDLITHRPGEVGTTIALPVGFHRIHITAYNVNGIHSAPSNEVQYGTPPTTLRILIEVGPNGEVSATKLP